MAKLYAQPHDYNTQGFYFETAEEYKTLSNQCQTKEGCSVQRFNFTWIANQCLDSELFEELDICQKNLLLFLEKIKTWSDENKEKILVHLELEHNFNIETDDPADIEVTYYKVNSFLDLAKELNPPKPLGNTSLITRSSKQRFDYPKIANELECSRKYGETYMNGKHIIYRCCY